MMANDSSASADVRPFKVIAIAILNSMVDKRGFQRPIERKSRLRTEIRSCVKPVAKHYLSEMPNHSMMLVNAIRDACTALDGLNRRIPFSAVLIVRGLMEAAADLFWLVDDQIDAVERTRRTCLIALRQHETLVRELVQFSERVSPEMTPPYREGLSTQQAIEDGWRFLRKFAEDMASAGYELKSSNRPGSKYFLDQQKPPISQLVDDMVKRLYGITRVNLYSAYSATAHAEGEGLGSLLELPNSAIVSGEEKHAYGLSEMEWQTRIICPSVHIAVRTAEMWIRLCLPSRAQAFAAETREVVQTFPISLESVLPHSQPARLD